MTITRREFNKAGLGALSLAALGGTALAGPGANDQEGDSVVG